MADQIWCPVPFSKERENGEMGRESVFPSWDQIIQADENCMIYWALSGLIDIQEKEVLLCTLKSTDLTMRHIFHAFCHCVLSHTTCKSISICQCQSHVVLKQLSKKSGPPLDFFVHFYSNCSWVLLFYTYCLLIVLLQYKRSVRTLGT